MLRGDFDHSLSIRRVRLGPTGMHGSAASLGDGWKNRRGRRQDADIKDMNKALKKRKGARAGKSTDSPDNATGGDSPPAAGRWLGVVVLLVAAGAGAGFLLLREGGAAGGKAGNESTNAKSLVVVPADLDALDPQFRAFLSDHIERLREAPIDPARQLKIGQIYAANNHWALARRCYANALRFDPGHTLARYHLAIATRKDGDRDQALILLRRLAEDEPGFTPVHHRLGVALLEAGQFKDAREAFERTVALEPTAPHGYVGLAEVALHDDRNEQAVELLEKALTLKPEIMLAHYLLGRGYRAIGRRADAERELRLGAGAKPQYMQDNWSGIMVRFAKGVAQQIKFSEQLLQAGEFDTAREMLQEIVRWHPDHVVAINDLAIVYLNLNNTEKAIELLERAAALDPDSGATSINLAACRLRTMELDAALVHADRAVELMPGVAQAHVTRAKTLMGLRRGIDAVEAQQTAVRLDPRNPAFSMDLGHMYVIQGDAEGARSAYKRVTELDPDSLEAQLRLCTVCLRLDLRGDAIAAFTVAQRLAPNHRQVIALARRMEELGY